MIGSLGEIVFEVSSEKILTFDGLSFSQKANYAEHSIHGRKSVLEYTGTSATSVSMNITLNSALGIDTIEELEGLKEIFSSHQAVSFVLDGKPQGEGLWVIESLGTNYNFLDNRGRPQIIEVSLTLKEYIDVNSDEITDEEFYNDYYGIGNW